MMLIAIISGIVMLSLLDRAARSDKIALAQMKARFDLFAIRDELRRRGRSGAVEENRWFSYMDTTLTRAIMSVEYLTVWHAVSYLHAIDPARFEAADRSRREAMSRNQALAELHERYTQCLWQLMRDRHVLLWRVLGIIAKTLGVLDGRRQKIVQALRTAPETSTLLEYAAR